MRFLTALIFVLAILFQKANSQSYDPVAISPMPEKVSNNAVTGAKIQDTFYVYSFAGIDTTKLYSGIHLRSYRHNSVTDSWDSIPSLPDTLGKIASAASRVGDTIYIIGGYYVYQNGGEATSAFVHRYDIVNNVYLSDGAPVPVPVDDHVQLVYRDSLILLITGWSNSSNVPDVQIYNPYTNSWSAGTSTPNTNGYKSFGAAGAILGDTIYYFGGARSSGSFGPQFDLRKGYIDPNDPTNISWSIGFFDLAVRGYRTSCFSTADGYVNWIGGSNQTYNFNGIAYNGSGGVLPLNRNLIYEPSTGRWEEDFQYNYPMDLRGIAKMNDSVLFLTGGMESGQSVTNSAWRLERRPFLFNGIHKNPNSTVDFSLFPNPSKGKIQVQSNDEILQVRIYSSKGKLEFQLLEPGRNLSLSHLLPGLYHMELRTKRGVGFQNFILQQKSPF
jgi:Secretion system C-terminal sorting domain